MKSEISLTRSLIIFTLLSIFLVIETTLQALGIVHPKIIEYVIVANSLRLFISIAKRFLNE